MTENEMKINNTRDYLRDTDYVCNKLIEAFANGNNDEINSLKTKYADVLVKRKEARQIINDLSEFVKIDEDVSFENDNTALKNYAKQLQTQVEERNRLLQERIEERNKKLSQPK